MILSPLRRLWKRARNAGFVAGYAAGVQDAPYIMPRELVEAFEAQYKASMGYDINASRRADERTYFVLRDLIKGKESEVTS